MDRYKLAIIEDNKTISGFLEYFFSKDADFELVLSAKSAEEFWKSQPQLDIDIVLCDIGLPSVSGTRITWELKQKKSDIQVVMYTVFEDKEKIFEALQAGASGYLLKDMKLPQIKNELLTVMNGGAAMSPQIARKVIDYFRLSENSKQKYSELTKRETEIVHQLRQGFCNKEIAKKLFISVETVKSHIKNIYVKLHVESRAQFYDLFKKPF